MTHRLSSHLNGALSRAMTVPAALVSSTSCLPLPLQLQRHALTHFDEWARGTGRGPQATRRKTGGALRDIAREYWPFGYDPAAGTISFGPYEIDIGIATELCTSIYAASRAVDAATTAELCARVIEALSRAGIGHSPPYSGLTVSSGSDMTIWISLTTGTTRQERQELSDRIIAALSAAGLGRESLMQAGASDSAERLAHAKPCTPGPPARNTPNMTVVDQQHLQNHIRLSSSRCPETARAAARLPHAIDPEGCLVWAVS